MPAREHGDGDLEIDENGEELLATLTALPLEVEPTLACEQQGLHLAPELTRRLRLDEHDAHEVRAGSDALVDVGVQAAHPSLALKIWLATVLAASASRVGLTWL